MVFGFVSHQWHVGAFSKKIKNPHMSQQGQEVSGPMHIGYDYMYSSQPPAWAHVNSNCGCCAGRNTSDCLGTAARPAGSVKITAATSCVDKNQLIEGNALKAFNEECDNYHFTDTAGEEGISSVKTQLMQDDSATIGNAVVAWLESAVAKKQAFMATVWFHTPHQNFAATEQWMALYANTSYTPEEKAYYADVSGMDYQIGMIRQKLMDLGVYADTALWFTAGEQGGWVYCIGAQYAHSSNSLYMCVVQPLLLVLFH
jgi:hypothetical protein